MNFNINNIIIGLKATRFFNIDCCFFKEIATFEKIALKKK